VALLDEVSPAQSVEGDKNGIRAHALAQLEAH
jgi:hypothetical protein